jgi:hypothetical protein
MLLTFKDWYGEAKDGLEGEVWIRVISLLYCILEHFD